MRSRRGGYEASRTLDELAPPPHGPGAGAARQADPFVVQLPAFGIEREARRTKTDRIEDLEHAVRVQADRIAWIEHYLARTTGGSA